MKEEAEQLSRESLDVWQKSGAVAQLDNALGAARGGRLSVSPPTSGDTVRSLLGGLQPTRRGLEPLEDRGYPLFPTGEHGCHLSAASVDPNAVPFRQHWLCAIVGVKDDKVTAAICIVRREEGTRGTTDIVKGRVHLVSGRRGDVSLIAKVRTAAEDMLALYVQDVVAEVRRVATARNDGED